MRLRSPRLLPLLAALAVAPLPATAADPARKACVADCNAAQSACLTTAASNDATARAACAAAADPGACEVVAKRIAKAAKKACKGARKACKRCCKSPQPSCVQAPELPVASGAFVAPEREALTAALEAAELEPGPDGRGFVLIRLPDGDLFVDPDDRSPASAAAECAEAMLHCIAPPERNIAGCFASVPVCRGKPWKGDGPMCCPAGCGERYQALRRSGQADEDAFSAAIFVEPSCIPGLPGHVAPAP
jgi:hypothetical protein